MERERLNLRVRKSRAHAMMRGKMGWDGKEWEQIKEENLRGRRRVADIEGVLRTIEMDREERNMKNQDVIDVDDPEM